MAHGKFDRPFRTLSFGMFICQFWTQETIRHILVLNLVTFEIYHYMMVPGPFKYFSENRSFQKIKAFLMKE